QSAQVGGERLRLVYERDEGVAGDLPVHALGESRPRVAQACDQRMRVGGLGDGVRGAPLLLPAQRVKRLLYQPVLELVPLQRGKTESHLHVGSRLREAVEDEVDQTSAARHELAQPAVGERAREVTSSEPSPGPW